MKTGAHRPMYRFDCGCEFPIIVEAKNPDDIPGLDFDINNIRMDCPATFALLGRGETKGVFQLESQLGKQYTKKLRPEADEHIGALGALLRPGCLKAVDERGVSMTTIYCRRKNGEESVPQGIELLDRILRPTYGVLTYQEQAMEIARVLAGFTLQEADALRKAIGKKLAEEMAKCRKLFMDGAAKTGIITEEQAATIFGWIQESQRYSFNKSHAIAYGIVGYQCAYIKAHFAPVFFSSWLTSAKEDAEPKQEIYELVQDSKLFGLDVQPPDFTQLNADFTTDHKTKVQFGLANISGIGPASLNKIFTAVGEAEQKIGKRVSDFNWVEFLVHIVPKKLSADVMKSLIRTGALRHFGQGRKKMEAEYDAWSVVAGNEKETAWLQENCQQAKWTSVIDALKAVARVKKEGGGCSTVKRVEKIQSEIQLLENPPSSVADTPNWIAWCEEQLLGISISCSELDGCDLSEVNTTCKDFLAGRDGYMVFGVKVESVREVKTKKGKNPGQKMAHLTISDNSCLLEEVVCFPDAYREFGSLLTKGSLLIIQGQRGDNGGLQVKKVWPAS